MNSKIIWSAAVVIGLAVQPVSACPPITVEILVRQGQPVPGLPGLILDRLGIPFLNGQGEIGFTGRLLDGGAYDHYVWYDDDVVWRNSQALPDVLDGIDDMMGISDAGEFIFATETNGLDSIWTDEGLALKEGDPAPGLPGLYVDYCRETTMLPDGTAHWVVTTSESPGGSQYGWALYRRTGGEIQPLLGTGHLLGGYPVIGLSHEYDFSPDGTHYAMRVQMDVPTGSPSFLAVDGELAIQGHDDGGGRGIWYNFESININDYGDYVFGGRIVGGAGHFAVAYNGAIVLDNGDPLILQLGIGLPRPRGLVVNHRNQVAHLWSSGAPGAEQALFVGNAPDLALSSVLQLRSGDEVDTDDDGVADAVVLGIGSTGYGPGIDFQEDDLLYLALRLADLGTGEEYSAVIRMEVRYPCPADVYGLEGEPDCVVDVIDLLVLLNNWGNYGLTDITGPDGVPDGTTDVFDLLLLLPCT